MTMKMKVEVNGYDTFGDVGKQEVVTNIEKESALCDLESEKNTGILPPQTKDCSDGEGVTGNDQVNVNSQKGVQGADEDPIIFIAPIPIPLTDRGQNDIVVKHGRKPDNHYVLFRKEKPLICTICDTGFPNKSLYQAHLTEAHGDSFKYPCKHCGKPFKNPGQRTTHERIHDPNRFQGEPKFGCEMCDKKYHLKVSLDTHVKKVHYGYRQPYKARTLKQHHSTGVRNHRPLKRAKELFKCPYCDLKFAMRCTANKHMLCHSDKQPYKCELCGQPLQTKQSLKNHMKNRHLNPSGKPRPMRPKYLYKKPCPCTVCGKVYKVASQLERHMRTHTGEKPFECSDCGEKFSDKGNLKSHIRNKHNRDNDGEKFKCLICGEDGFVSISRLMDHRRRAHRHIPHDTEKEKPYGCGICGKPYYIKNTAMVCTLLRHDPSSLLKAMFRFKCPECPEERFGYHNTIALRKHWEKEHPEKPLPIRYRACSGMYGKEVVDKLPKIVTSTEEERRIRQDGPPPVELEYPLYIEFSPPTVETVFYKDVLKTLNIKKEKKERDWKFTMGPYTCHICGAMVKYMRNFKRHVELHSSGWTPSRIKMTPKSVNSVNPRDTAEIVRKTLNLKKEDDEIKVKSAPGPFTCHICGAIVKYMRNFKQHLASHSSASIPSRSKLASNSVNIRDTAEIARILGNRTVRIIVKRLVISDTLTTSSSCDTNLSLPTMSRSLKMSNFKGKPSRKKIIDPFIGNKLLKVVLCRLDI